MRNIPPPICMRIETTNQCPLNCAFCPNTGLNPNKQNMSLENFKKIIDICTENGIRYIGLMPRNGDHFLNPFWKEMMVYLEEKTEIEGYHVFSNILVLGPKKINLSPFKKMVLNLSIAGLSETEFKEYNNLKSEKKFSMIKEIPRIIEGVQYILAPLTELKDRVNILKGGYTNISSPKLMGTWLDRIDTTKISCNFNNKTKPEGLVCEVFKRKNIILPNGDYLCCGCVDLDATTKIGNIFNDSLTEIWDKKNNIPEPEICKQCKESEMWYPKNQYYKK